VAEKYCFSAVHIQFRNEPASFPETAQDERALIICLLAATVVGTGWLTWYSSRLIGQLGGVSAEPGHRPVS